VRNGENLRRDSSIDVKKHGECFLKPAHGTDERSRPTRRLGWRPDQWSSASTDSGSRSVETFSCRDDAMDFRSVERRNRLRSNHLTHRHGDPSWAARSLDVG